MGTLLATFLVGAAIAAPTTGEATSVTATSATLNGTAVGATSASFQYGVSTAYGVSVPATIAADGSVQATVSVTPNTTYHFRIEADGEFGQDKTFTSAPNPTAPGVSSQSRRDVTATSANLSATLNPHGGETTYYFQYGTTTSYGGKVPNPAASAGSGTTAATVAAALTRLRPYTRYHWRLVATNAAGTTRGSDRTFTTARAPTAVSLGVSRSTVPWGRGVSLGGRVSGPGSVALTVALEQQRFPFDVGFKEVATARTSRDGGYLFTIDSLLGATRFRVLTRTQTIIVSPVVTARTAVRPAVAVRNLSRTRARIEGSIVPAVHGTVSLQRRSASGRWAQVRHATVKPRGTPARTTFRFKVFRARKATRRYRVVALPVRGAYVRGTSRHVFVSRRPRR